MRAACEHRSPGRVDIVRRLRMGAAARSAAEPSGSSPTGPGTGEGGILPGRRLWHSERALSADWLWLTGRWAVSGRRLLIMPRHKDLKRLARARMAATGERYTQALTHVLSQPVLEPLAAAWVMTGSH